MPSDNTTSAAVLEALTGDVGDFTNAVGTTSEEVRHFLADQQATIEGHVSHLGAELGPFGREYLDPIRFAALFDHDPSTDRHSIQKVERALATLNELEGCEGECFTARVEPGKSLRDTVDHTLARLGRAFGAARVVQAVKSGQYSLNNHARTLGSFPFGKWNRSERGLAPPIVVTVQGEDLRVASLAEFMDGRQKIVLIVEGTCTPAPLVRVISPSTYVAQVHEVDQLGPFVAWQGAGIAAIVPDTSAAFTHDPAKGAASWNRLTIVAKPETPPRRPLGGLSAAQQSEELRLLESLAAAPAVPEAAPAATAATEDVDPADKLAAWLLTQADMSDIGKE